MQRATHRQPAHFCILILGSALLGLACGDASPTGPPAGQSQVGLVNQGSRLQRVIRALRPHQPIGRILQFSVQCIEEFAFCRAVARFPLMQQYRDGHDGEDH